MSGRGPRSGMFLKDPEGLSERTGKCAEPEGVITGDAVY